MGGRSPGRACRRAKGRRRRVGSGDQPAFTRVREGVVLDTQLSVVLAIGGTGARPATPDRAAVSERSVVDRRSGLAAWGSFCMTRRESRRRVQGARPFLTAGRHARRRFRKSVKARLVIGEGLSLEDRRGLAETLLQFGGRRGVPVLCLAPAQWEFSVSGSGGDPQTAPRRARWLRGDPRAWTSVSTRIPGRPMAAWRPAGLELSTAGRGALLSVARPRGWRWLEVVYPQGGRPDRVRVRHRPALGCGPHTPRWLLVRILERFSEGSERAVVSFEKE